MPVATLNRLLSGCCLWAALGAMAQPEPGTAAGDAADAGSAWPSGRLTLQLRPRLATVDQGNKPLRAEAANLRTLLGWASHPVGELRFVAQLLDVSWRHPLHASNQPGDPKSPYPLVGDPPTSRVNQLYVEHGNGSDTVVRLGRQPIRLDNERFVGDADVRQVPQVFDAITMRNTSLPQTRLFAGVVRRAHTYYGHAMRSRTLLFNARTELDGGASLGAYGYFIGQPNAEYVTLLPDNSQRTIGLRLEGNRALGDEFGVYYAIEAAQQRAWRGGDSRIRAGYGRLAFGPSWGAYSLQASVERLGSNAGAYGLQTPLSYNMFQGWAYEFFNTPRTGVRDRSLAAAAAYGRLNLWLKFHRFDATWGGARYGKEWDFAAVYQLRADLSARLLIADFRRTDPLFRPSAQRYTATLQYDY